MLRAIRTVALIGTMAILLALVGTVAATAQSSNVVQVWKDPYCGCCVKWINQMKAAGFQIRVHNTNDLTEIKKMLGVPDQLRSCHTAKIGDYVIEGHVPIADVKRLLGQKPTVVGISVPGMPIGSPGMEVRTGETEPYEVATFDKNGATSVFAKHN